MRTIIITMVYLFLVFSTVYAQGLYESFEDEFPPAGWIVLDYGKMPNNSWGKWPFAPYDGSYTAASPLTIESNGTNDGNYDYNEWLLTPQLICSENVADTLQFYFRRGNPSPFYMAVKISTSNIDTSSFTTTLLEIPDTVASFTWKEYKVPLDTYDGIPIYIAFQYKSNTSSYSPVQIDMITGPPLYRSSDDVGMDSILIPQDSTIISTSIQPKAIVKNYGIESKSFTVKCEIDPAGQSGGTEYADSIYVQNLEADSTLEVIFSKWLPSSFSEQKYNVKIYTTLINDENPENDTLLSTIWADDSLPTNDNFSTAYFISTNSFTDTSYTLGMTDDYDYYGQIPWPETGPDVVYAIIIGQQVDILQGSIFGMSSDLDIFLLNDPNPQALVAYGGESFTFTNVPPDTYYVVIDGFHGAAEPPGSFILQVQQNIVVGIQDPINNVPAAYDLKQNYPNPFNPTTIISYDLPIKSEVELSIYNILGQKVITLVNTNQPPGSYNVIWDGRNEIGERVASGIYIYQIKMGNFIKTRKMILMK